MGNVFNKYGGSDSSSSGLIEIPATWSWSRSSGSTWLTFDQSVTSQYQALVLCLYPSGTDTTWRSYCYIYIPIDGTVVQGGWRYSENPGSGHMYSDALVRLHVNARRSSVYVDTFSYGRTSYLEPTFIGLYGIK